MLLAHAKYLLAFCEDLSDYSRVPMRQHASFFNLRADGTVRRTILTKMGTSLEVKFAGLVVSGQYLQSFCREKLLNTDKLLPFMTLIQLSATRGSVHIARG